MQPSFWRYGPGAVKCLFHNLDDVPDGWASTPAAFYDENENPPPSAYRGVTLDEARNLATISALERALDPKRNPLDHDGDGRKGGSLGAFDRGRQARAEGKPRRPPPRWSGGPAGEAWLAGYDAE